MQPASAYAVIAPRLKINTPLGGALSPQGSPPPWAEHLVPRAQEKNKLTFLLTFFDLPFVLCCVFLDNWFWAVF